MKKPWKLAAAMCAGVFGCFPAWSAGETDYPKKPVRIVVPYSPGGTTDRVARLMASALTERLGQTFYVENRPGATGAIGASTVAKSTADGYTLLANETGYAMLPSLFAKLPWDHAKDLAPITTLVTTPVVLLVSASSPYQTLGDLVQRAKDRPGSLNFGSGGLGSAPHFSAELFAQQAGVQLTHIPYKGGGDAMAALMANQVALLLDAPPTAMGFIQSGKVRALAISSAKRSASLPEVPTFAESGFSEFRPVNWFGLAAPRGTPETVLRKLHTAVVETLRTPDVANRLADMGVAPGGIAPADFSAFIASETRRWGELAQKIGITPESVR